MSLGGLDVGTNVCRLIVFNESGEMLTSAYKEYPLISSQGFLEIDPNKLWHSVCDVCREASLEVKDDPIEAIAVSAMGDTLIATNRNFEPVGNAILAFDTRSREQCERLVDQLGFENIFRVTGMPAHPMSTASKVLWMLDSAGKEGKIPARFMCTEDFVISRFTGTPILSWSTAGRTMMFNCSIKKWWAEMLNYLTIDEENLSKVVPSATTVGKISKRIAKDLGLSKDVIIVTAGHDQICSAIGSGAVKYGMVSDNTGTFECVIVGVDGIRKNEVDMKVLADNNLAFYLHGPENLWAAFAWFNSGSVINWCKNNLFSLEEKQARAKGKDIFDLIFAELDDKPTKVQFMPHLTGTGTPWLNPGASGVMVGFDLGTDRYDIFKAVLQGIGYDLILNLESFEKAGISIKEVRVTGGGSRSSKWVQLKADMMGREVTTVHMPEASAMGAAICAGTAVGKFGSIIEGAEQMTTLEKIYQPDMILHEKYMAAVECYRTLYKTILKYREDNKEYC